MTPYWRGLSMLGSGGDSTVRGYVPLSSRKFSREPPGPIARRAFLARGLHPAPAMPPKSTTPATVARSSGPVVCLLSPRFRSGRRPLRPSLSSRAAQASVAPEPENILING